MTPKQREHVEKMVEPSWRRAGSPTSQGERFVVYTTRRDLEPMLFPPRGMPGPVSTTYYIARLERRIFIHDGWQIKKLFAHVEGNDIQVLLHESRQ